MKQMLQIAFLLSSVTSAKAVDQYCVAGPPGVHVRAAMLRENFGLIRAIRGENKNV